MECTEKLDDLIVQNDILYLESDPRVVIIDETTATKAGRDSYLQRLYKNQLKEESVAVFGKVVCMAEQLDYPALIASHIKPYIQCNEQEAFDVNNGLLLSLNLDALFDQGQISFTDEGQLLVTSSRDFSQELVNYLSKYSLDERLLNDQRKQYFAVPPRPRVSQITDQRLRQSTNLAAPHSKTHARAKAPTTPSTTLYGVGPPFMLSPIKATSQFTPTKNPNIGNGLLNPCRGVVKFSCCCSLDIGNTIPGGSLK